MVELPSCRFTRNLLVGRYGLFYVKPGFPQKSLQRSCSGMTRSDLPG